MEQDATYIKGFNAGYKLAEFNPELFEKLKNSLSKGSDFERGVLEGAEEFAKSRVRGREEDLKAIRNSKGEDRKKDVDLQR